MTLLDWILVGLIVLLALRGFYTGFISGVLSLAGLALGAYLGSRLALYLVQAEPNFVTYTPFVLLAGALVFAVLGQLLAGSIGGRIGASLRRIPVVGTLDGMGGAILGAAVGLLFVWVLGTFALQSPLPQSLREPVERSEVLAAMDERLPSGLVLDTIASLDSIPQIEGPRPRVAEPELPDSGKDIGGQGVEDATQSVVQVVATDGSGYGSGSSGSGWVAAPETVITNAHVIAESGQVTVRQEGAWQGYEAKVLTVDQTNDVAVLEVDGLDLPVLPVAEPESGESVAIVGYPYGGPLDAEPGRIGGTSQAITRDAYGNGPVNRYITSIRGEANPGNSGGPAVNGEGEVVGTVFASAGYGDIAYAIPPSVVSERLKVAQGQVASTGLREVGS